MWPLCVDTHIRCVRVNYSTIVDALTLAKPLSKPIHWSLQLPMRRDLHAPACMAHSGVRDTTYTSIDHMLTSANHVPQMVPRLRLA